MRAPPPAGANRDHDRGRGEPAKVVKMPICVGYPARIARGSGQAVRIAPQSAAALRPLGQQPDALGPGACRGRLGLKQA
jgi:hypothetical protein